MKPKTIEQRAAECADEIRSDDAFVRERYGKDDRTMEQQDGDRIARITGAIRKAIEADRRRRT